MIEGMSAATGDFRAGMENKWSTNGLKVKSYLHFQYIFIVRNIMLCRNRYDVVIVV